MCMMNRKAEEVQWRCVDLFDIETTSAKAYSPVVSWRVESSVTSLPITFALLFSL